MKLRVAANEERDSLEVVNLTDLIKGEQIRHVFANHDCANAK